MHKAWKIRPVVENRIHELSTSLGISTLLARLLILRGLETDSDFHNFLSPTPQLLFSPFSFLEMQTAVDRILQAKDGEERVLIHGDYDVDGITGTCILLETLWKLGIHADYFIPDRLDEGYGIQENNISRFAQEYDLLITVDCGTTAIESVKKANALGLDVIITDHHDPGQERPPALAVINPLCSGESYPFKPLSGSAVAWKLATALRINTDSCHNEIEQAELVILGTVADMMPLLGENRALLCLGQECFFNRKRPGLSALMELAKVNPKMITPFTIGFYIAPRLNAAGRLDDPRLALELLLTKDETHGWELAQELHELNNQRKRIETSMIEDACALIQSQHLDSRSHHLLFVANEGWHRGVLGTVAHRIQQRYGKPTFLFSIEDDIAYGSVRSREDANLIPLLNHIRPLTLSCGGHTAAAGIKCHKDKLSEIEKILYETGEKEWIEQAPQPLWLDASLRLEKIDENLMKELKRLEPFGKSNEEPLFYTRASVSGYGAKIVGNNHLRISFQHPRGIINAIGFNQGEKIEHLNGNEMEIAFHCRYNEYQGRREIQLYLADIRPYTPKSEENLQSAQKTNSRSMNPKNHALDRNKLGRIYKLLSNAADENMQLPRQHSFLLAQLEKISKTEFTLALKIFVELDLLTVSEDKITIKKTDKKKELSDSPTFRSLQQGNTLSP